MRKLSIGIIAGLCIALAFSFKTVYDLKNSTAEAQQVDGLLVFSNSMPLKEYRVIGTLLPSSFKTDYRDIFTNINKKVKKTYPTAQGYILKYHDEKYSFECDVIEFK